MQNMKEYYSKKNKNVALSSVDGSDGRAVASYSATPGSNPTVSGSVMRSRLKSNVFQIPLVAEDHGFFPLYHR